MTIKSPKELKLAIKKVISGNNDLVFDVAKYVANNYFMSSHLKGYSIEYGEIEKIYKQFEKKHPDHFDAVDLWVKYLLKKD